MLARKILFVDPSGVRTTRQSPFTTSTTSTFITDMLLTTSNTSTIVNFHFRFVLTGLVGYFLGITSHHHCHHHCVARPDVLDQSYAHSACIRLIQHIWACHTMMMAMMV